MKLRELCHQMCSNLMSNLALIHTVSHLGTWHLMTFWLSWMSISMIVNPQTHALRLRRWTFHVWCGCMLIPVPSISSFDCSIVPTVLLRVMFGTIFIMCIISGGAGPSVARWRGSIMAEGRVWGGVTGRAGIMTETVSAALGWVFVQVTAEVGFPGAGVMARRGEWFYGSSMDGGGAVEAKDSALICVCQGFFCMNEWWSGDCGWIQLRIQWDSWLEESIQDLIWFQRC